MEATSSYLHAARNRQSPCIAAAHRVALRRAVVGTQLNHYRVTRALGSGGMGEVYEAEDTRLRRTVALKVLPPAVADDADRRLRFEREARAIAALNHPNIVTVHSIEQAGDRLFVTMEFVQGQTLSRLIPLRGLPLGDFLRLATPIADALGAAHRGGVVHRDLKPDNIMVGTDGRVKILDFGLAQLRDVSRDGELLTITTPQQLTSVGQVIGTVAYMSPEQAQGLEVDARSDIFSLGIVLFEMATGERPFKGDTSVAVLSSIVKDAAPSVGSVNPVQPSEVERIIRRCLAKDPARRYQSAIDVRNDLDDLPQTVGGSGGAASPSRTASGVREIAAWTAAALLLVALVIMSVNRAPAIDAPNDVLSVVPPEKTTLTEGEAPQVSPDGMTIAFVATDQAGRTLLYLRDRGTLTARALTETDDATMPFWSPDSRSLGFFAGGKLKRVDVAGGRPQTLAEASVPRGGTWSTDDVIVFVPFPEMPPHRVAAKGGQATALPVERGALRWLPSFLPDGRHYVYLAFSRGAPEEGIHVGSLDSPETTFITASNTSATYVSSGHVIFRRDEALVSQRFNATSRQLEGSPVVLADRVSFNPVTQQLLASASANGALALLGSGQLWHLTWFDRTGRRLMQAGTIGGYNSLCLSFDGTHVVYDVADPRSGNIDLWTMDLSTAAPARLTFHRAADFYVACAPTSDDVIFASPRNGTPNLHRVKLSTPGGDTMLGESPLPALPSQWTRDGRTLLYSAFSPKTDFDIWMVPVTGGTATAVVATEAADKGGQLSWDGKWIAYASGQAGNYEVFVQAFPPAGARWQISKNGGRQPQWAPDGKQLFYISPEKKLIAVDVDGSTPRFVVKSSRILVDTRVGGWERTHLGNPYAISADGTRLLVANASDESLPVTVMLNWLSQMR